MPRSVVVCPYCGALESPGSGICRRCSKPLIIAPIRQSPEAASSRRNSVTRPLQYLYVSVFLVTYFLALASGGSFFELIIPGEHFIYAMIRLGSLYEIAVLEAGEWYRLLTATFLHFGAIHLFFNVSALGAVGPETEKNLGRWRLLVVYFLAGVISNSISLAWHAGGPFWEELRAPFNQAGASGAICGLIGALYSVARLRGGMYGQVVRKIVIRWIVMIAVMGFVFPGIDNAAHFSGIVAGLVLTRVVGLKDRGIRSL